MEDEDEKPEDHTCYDCGGYAMSDNLCFVCYDLREYGLDEDEEFWY